MRPFLAFIPRPLRLGAFLLAVGVILLLTLLPSEDIPGEDMIWDKAAHAIAFGTLTILGLLLSTHRRWKVVLAVWCLGVAIEIAQALMAFGRQGDWRDVVGDTVGVAAGLTLWAIARRFKPKPRDLEKVD